MSITTLAPAAPPLAPPFTVTTDPYRQAALDWVNHVRGQLGFAPLSDLRAEGPGGEARHSRKCPIAMSISEPRAAYGAQGHASTTVFGDEGEETTLFSEWSPDGVREFVGRFDADEYPDLRAGAR